MEMLFCLTSWWWQEFRFIGNGPDCKTTDDHLVKKFPLFSMELLDLAWPAIWVEKVMTLMCRNETQKFEVFPRGVSLFLALPPLCPPRQTAVLQGPSPPAHPLTRSPAHRPGQCRRDFTVSCSSRAQISLVPAETKCQYIIFLVPENSLGIYFLEKLC